MSRKIIGVTVGTQLPKPNFKQTDPTKGDYIKNKPDFDGLKSKVDNKADLVDGKVPVAQLPDIDLSGYYTKSETDASLVNKADLIGGKVPLEQLPDNTWNDLQDKPFEEISPAQVITWDGNTDGLPSTSIDLDMGDGVILTFACYKISDIIVPEEFIKGASCDCTTPDGSLSCEVDMILGKNSNKSFYVTNSQLGVPLIYVVNQANDSVIYDDGSMTFTLTFPETGIWFLKGIVEGSVFIQTNSLTVPAIIKTLDPKYIADMYYDTRKIYRFDGNETPNPPSYPVEAFGVNGYKIFDLTPTLEEFFDYTIIYNNGFNGSTTEITFTSKQVQLSWSDAWMIQSDQNYTFALCHSAGTFEADYQGIHIVCEVPEPGIYLMWSQPLSNMTFEINLGGELKQIDPKFIPADLDFNLDDYYTKSEVYSKSETYNKSEVDSKLQNTKVDLSNYYTKSEVDTAIDKKVDTAIDKKEVDWEDVTNKPIGENSVSITWNGNSVGEHAITIARIERAVDVMKFVRINDTPITNVDVVCGGQIHLNTNGTIETIDISPDMFETMSDNVWCIGFPYILNVLATDTIKIVDTTYTVYPGVYLLAVFNSDIASQASTYVSYCQIDAIKQLDPKFISLENSLENYYTKENVYTKSEVQDIHNNLGSRLSSVESNFGNYYSKSEINSKGYLTSIPEEYVTDSELANKGYLTSIPEEYVTDSELANKGYLTSVPDEYITETELNNKGYLTEHQSLEGYVTTAFLDEKKFLTSVPEEYITNNELEAKGYLTEHQNLDEYITETELNSKGYLTEHQSLEGYVTETSLSEKGYLTDIPEDYITESELNSKGYLTEHQSLEAYVTNDELNAKGYLTTVPDEYVTSTELNDAIEAFDAAIADIIGSGVLA